MSKTAAKIVNGLINVVTLPLSARQKEKTMAHIIRNMSEKGFDAVQTKRGILKLYGRRASNIASTVANWERDEPETRLWIETYVKTGDVFWDIGANVGIFSIYANMGETVKTYAFEPSSLNFALLTEHLALNGMNDKVITLPIAFGDQNCIETLYFKNSEQGAACNSVGLSETQFGAFEAQYQHNTIVYTIDDFIKTYGLEQPDHLKLDVDGLEDLILKGATQTLKGIKTLIVELEGKNDNNPLIEKILADAGLEYSPELESMGTGRNKLYKSKRA